MDVDNIFSDIDFDILFDNYGNDDDNTECCVCGEEEETETTPTPITTPVFTEEDQTYIRQVRETFSMYEDLLKFVDNCAKGLVETKFCYIRSKKYVRYLLLTEVRNLMSDRHFIKQRYIDRYYEIKRIYFVYERDEE